MSKQTNKKTNLYTLGAKVDHSHWFLPTEMFFLFSLPFPSPSPSPLLFFSNIWKILVNFKEKPKCHTIIFKYISGFTSYNTQILLSCHDICICNTLKCQAFIKYDSANVAQLFPKPRTRLGINLKLTKLMRLYIEELTFFDVKEHRRIQNVIGILTNLLVVSGDDFFKDKGDSLKQRFKWKISAISQMCLGNAEHEVSDLVMPFAVSI